MLKIQNLWKLKSIPVLVSFLVFGVVANAQLKIGDNPTNIQKSAILELESTRQGLLLPRLADTANINLLTPPDGMIIYLNSDNSLRLRSNGSWKKIADMAAATANWSLTGNSNIDSTNNFIGTLDGKPLTLKTNGTARMIVGSNGNVGIGTTTPSAKLNVNGSVKFENLGASTTDVDVLVLAPDGSVYKRTISSSAFDNAIKAINGIQKQTLSITAAASDTSNNVLVQNRTADSTIALYLPVQNGSAGAARPYGFLTYSDWQKIQSSVQTFSIGAVAASANAKGADYDSTSKTLTLHPADVSNPGIVTAGTQTFGGNKTFAGNTTVSGTTTLSGNTTVGGTTTLNGATAINAATTVNGNTTLNGTVTMNGLSNNTTYDSVLVINNGVVEKRQVSAAAFGNAIRSINGNRDTAQTFSFGTAPGTGDLNIVMDNTTTPGTNAIKLNVPDATATVRGVVNTSTQTFGGIKTFQDSVTAAKSIKVGNTGNANSTVQVDGSLSMKIRTVTVTGAVLGTDNTILADASGGAITLTLPSASGIAGRIYTIKKIGGDLANDVTINPTGGTIEGGANYKIYNDWTYVTIQTDGINWYIIKK
jgi:hypothetical protein